MPSPRQDWSAELDALRAKVDEIDVQSRVVLAVFEREELSTVEAIRLLMDMHAQARQILGRRQTSILRTQGNWGSRGYKWKDPRWL